MISWTIDFIMWKLFVFLTLLYEPPQRFKKKADALSLCWNKNHKLQSCEIDTQVQTSRSILKVRSVVFFV